MSTAGKIIQSNDLITYTRCTELYHLKGSYEDDPFFKLLVYTMERALVSTLRNNKIPYKHLNKYALKYIQDHQYLKYHLDGAVQNWLNKVVIYASDFFQIFKPTTYSIVAGPTPMRIKINDTPIEPRVSAIFQGQNTGNVNLVYFTPFKSEHDRLNDPNIALILQLAEELIKPQYKKTYIWLHILGYQENTYELEYKPLHIKQLPPQALPRSYSIIQGMEAGLHWPALPCPNPKCKFRQLCFTGEKNE